MLDQNTHSKPPPQTTDRNATVPLILDCPLDAATQPISVGIPLPRGQFANTNDLLLTDEVGSAVPVQAEQLASWQDGSVRWLLLDFMTAPLLAGSHRWQLRSAASTNNSTSRSTPLRCDLTRSEFDTGVAVFHVGRKSGQSLLQATVGGREILHADGLRITLSDAKGKICTPRIDQFRIEHAGPIRATVCIEGMFAGKARCRFVARLCFFAGTGLVRLRLTIHNPRRAQHRGNLWDLGDPGSVYLRDLTLGLELANARDARVRWSEEPGQPFKEVSRDKPLEIYQDSSGGANWQSRNHVNRNGQVPLTFRGYRVRSGDSEHRGLRANPIVRLLGSDAAVTVAAPEFWQQFPKAIESGNNALRVGLFPRQFADVFELQGGEQKTHTVWFHFGDPGTLDSVLNWVHRPAIARTTPEFFASSGAFSDLAPKQVGIEDQFDRYLQPVLEGPSSLVASREIIDEYGWRNFGDIYADHENAYYDGPKPVISHYNNQFDSVFGAILQFVRTGDRRWREISDPLARHVIDIDIYHTEQDRAAYRGGLFWMTDHYKDAATSTHRTFSKVNNRPGHANGGGPGNEHNFTTGLLDFYFLTGDPLAREAVLSLVDWVMRMDDGRLNILSWLDSGSTGLASLTGDPAYHGPGRGPGFSINALLDGWLLTGKRTYLEKSEELIRRCIHPYDEIAARDLLNAERRWSYPVFLTAVARFLSLKAEINELNFMYAYARAALLHYVSWMVEHERPYFDFKERLEFPTETWPAQEFRKANVMRMAAAYADEPLRARLLQRGRELADSAWTDLLSFESRHVARAVAILMSEGTRDQFFRRGGIEPAPLPCESFDFGRPTSFIPQKQRVIALFRSPRGLASIVTRLFVPRSRLKDC